MQPCHLLLPHLFVYTLMKRTWDEDCHPRFISPSDASFSRLAQLNWQDCNRVCVCVPERGFSQSVGGQLIGFFLHLTWPSEWARVGFMCVHPTVQVCWWVHSVHTWQPTCVVVFFCCFLGEGGGYMSVCEFDFVYTCQTADSFWVWKGTVYRLTAHREELFGGQILPMCKASCWQSGVKGWSCQVFLFLPICLFLPFTALSLTLCQHRLFFPPSLATCHLACLESAVSSTTPAFSSTWATWGNCTWRISDK